MIRSFGFLAVFTILIIAGFLAVPTGQVSAEELKSRIADLEKNAGAAMRSQDFAAAESIYREAIKAVAADQGEIAEIEKYIDTAFTFRISRQPEYADRFIDEAFALARSRAERSPAGYIQIGLIKFRLAVYETNSNKERAILLHREAIEAFDASDDDGLWRGRARNKLADLFYYMGNLPEAEKLLDEGNALIDAADAGSDEFPTAFDVGARLVHVEVKAALGKLDEGIQISDAFQDVFDPASPVGQSWRQSFLTAEIRLHSMAFQHTGDSKYLESIAAEFKGGTRLLDAWKPEKDWHIHTKANLFHDLGITAYEVGAESASVELLRRSTEVFYSYIETLDQAKLKQAGTFDLVFLIGAFQFYLGEYEASRASYAKVFGYVAPGKEAPDFRSYSAEALNKDLSLMKPVVGYFRADFAATGNETSRQAFIRALDVQERILGKDRDSRFSRILSESADSRTAFFLQGAASQINELQVFKFDPGVPMIVALFEHYTSVDNTDITYMLKDAIETYASAPEFRRDLSSYARLLTMLKARDKGALSKFFEPFVGAEARVTDQIAKLEQLIPSLTSPTGN